MTLSLAKLQKNFALALRYQSQADECHIVADQFSAEEHMQIYRNNFIVSLCEILGMTYPLVKALVGDDCFSGLARAHVLSHPMTQGDVTSYGEHFDQTIASTPLVINTLPYLAEMARLEYCVDLSSRVAAEAKQNPNLLTLDKLSNVEEELQGAICLHLRQSVLPIQSPFSVFSIREAIAHDQFEGIPTNCPEQGIVCSDLSGYLIVQTLPKPAFELLLDIEQRKSLQEISQDALSQLPTLLNYQLIQGFSLKPTED